MGSISVSSPTAISQMSDYVPPTDFSGTIGFTGFSVAPNITFAYYMKVGKLVTVSVSFGFTSGTSNATTMTITGLPYAGRTGTTQTMSIPEIEDLGVISGVAGLGLIVAGATVITVFKTAYGAFTASSSKGARFTFTYMVD